MSPSPSSSPASFARPTHRRVQTPCSVRPSSKGTSNVLSCVPPSATSALRPGPSHEHDGYLTMRSVERVRGIVGFRDERGIEKRGIGLVERTRAAPQREARGRGSGCVACATRCVGFADVHMHAHARAHAWHARMRMRMRMRLACRAAPNFMSHVCTTRPFARRAGTRNSTHAPPRPPSTMQIPDAMEMHPHQPSSASTHHPGSEPSGHST